MTAGVDSGRIIRALRGILPPGGGAAGLHEPRFCGNEWAYVKECLDTGWVSSLGKFVDRFESDLAAYTGAKRAVAVVNGTAALHICLKLAGVEPDDEVIIPALTFVATANAVTYCGAVPHLADSSERTLGLDPRRLEEHLKEITTVSGGPCMNKRTGRRIKAVVPMHTFGHPVDIEALMELCGRFNLTLIEDAAESLGSFYKGAHTGTFGRLSALSFNGNKIITTGGGGAILTNDEGLGRLAKHITTTARVAHRWAIAHDMAGYNYRMPNVNAAIGCAQLERMTEFLADKRRLAERYRAAFEGMDGVRFFTEPAFARSNYWLNAILLDESFAHERDRLLELTNAEGITTRPAWTLMQRLPMFKGCPGMDTPVAESIERRLINIPSSAALGADRA
ncbi:MAG: LegC family aminotransferase [Deltaproteobacteria bacterium]|nr:LegC family aminotransferase [Deltaproteobacteria bacterium]